MHGDEAGVHSVEELYILALLLKLCACRGVGFRPPLAHVPHNDLIAIAKAAKRHQVSLVAGEGESLNALIMVADAIQNVLSVKVPDNHCSFPFGAHLLTCR